MKHIYVIFPAHVEYCKFSKEEYENLWWDQDDKPNCPDGLNRLFYELECAYDTNDPGLISGYTIEMYLLTIYNEEKVKEIYPLVSRLLDLKPDEYNSEIYGKRHLDKEIIEYGCRNIPKDEKTLENKK